MDIRAAVIAAVSELAKADGPILGDTNLQKDLMLDSLNLTYLIVTLEEKLDIEIDLSLLSAQNLETVDDICALVQKSVQS
jgi:acyl carrier protein